jgi:hypothetical protein
MKDSRKYDVELMTPKGWLIVAEGISYDEFLDRFGTGNYAEYRLWSV